MKLKNHTFLLLSFSLLFLPIFIVFLKNSLVFNLPQVFLLSGVLSVFLYTLFLILSHINRAFAKLLVLGFFTLFFFIRLTLSFIYEFSGRGFVSEFFAHFSLDSFIIGFSDYGLVFSSLVFMFFILIWVLFKALKQPSVLSLPKALPVFFGCLFFLFWFREELPEWRLIQSFNRYYTYDNKLVELDKNFVRSTTSKILAPLRSGRKLPIEKSDIVAKINDNPKNIILIYLESFSDILTNNLQYPNLTPYLDKLKNENTSFSNNFSSAYVTIEGIANSQCGTLMNIDSGNNSLTNKKGRLPNLPCLGDVLKVAGYQQVYMGGSDLAFAGKGAFLQEHGYDEVWGKKKWAQISAGKQNNWGLTDPDLFDQALIKIKKLNMEGKPFNFTLLTLGTHIPGFSYRGCPLYAAPKNQNTFLNAIHCSDKLLGSFIENLKKENLLKNTVVYIQGDHPIFPTHKMKDLFGKKSLDKRLFNVIIDETITSKHIKEDQPTSSLNLVANILDLLNIKHNVNFIYAQSDFDGFFEEKPYLLTRYDDFYGNEKLFNSTPQNTCDKKTPISLPLSPCEKSMALRATYQLGASYSLHNFDQQVCQMDVEHVFNKDSTFQIRWGNLNASDLFYSQGRLLKKQRHGLYLLKLDKNDNITSQLFYQPSDRIGLKSLIKYINLKGSRFVLFTNLTKKPKDNSDLIKKLPLSVFMYNFFYAYNDSGIITPVNEKPALFNELIFTPLSCTGGFKINKIKKQTPLVHQTRGKETFCNIDKWGPKNTLQGESFNKQTTGLSAFWLKTTCVPKDAIFRISGTPLKTFSKLPVITAAIDNTLVNKAKTYQLDLYSPKLNKSQTIGSFVVFHKEKEPLFLPKNIKNTSLPSLIAHAGGGYKKQPYLNSLDALNHNYKLGHRFFEIDFNWTSDKKLVAIHDWKETYQRLFSQPLKNIPTEKEFLQLKMKLKQTQLNLSRLDSWLLSHPDAFIITDIRGNNFKGLTQMKNFMKSAPSQIIPQMYHPSNYENLRSLGYDNIIFTLYATHLPTNALVDFIKSTSLLAITINPTKTDFDVLLNALKNTDTFIYVHTFNTTHELKLYLNKGVDGIYTDFLYLKNQEIFKQ